MGKSVLRSLEGSIITEQSSKYTGNAVLLYENGDSYTGSIANGKKEGYGTYLFGDGTTYSGYYVNGKREGIGKLAHRNKGFYEGHFINDERSGIGTEKYANGDVYYGEWKNNQRHGIGKYIFAANKEKFIGEWDSGNLKVGRWFLEGGLVYCSNFQFNKPFGAGIWEFSSGLKLPGNYKAD